MNILFINSSRTWGGGERWLMDISRGLQERGHTVHVVCHPGSALEQRITSVIPKPDSISITGDINPVSIYKIYRLLKAKRIEIVCTNFEKDLRVGGIAAMLAGVPVVPSREVDFPINNTWINKLFYSRIASGILVNSYATLNTLLINSPWLQQQRMEVVWKGSSRQITKETHSSGSSFKKSHGSILVGFVGRLDEQKGIPTLLEAMRIVNDQNANIQLVIAGEGNLRDSIEEFTRRHRMEESIILAGFQKNVDSFLDSIDFLVVPSYWEGFGYTALEAMSHGKAVIATHTSSLPEIVIEGRTGLLVPPRSPENLAEAILRMSGDTVLREKMGREGAERAEQVFSLSSMINKTEAFFLSIL